MINQLMSNPAAANIYATIPGGAPPVQLADDYILAKLDGDKDTCLAIECHLRDVARVHFIRDDVREALASMERYKAARIPGRSGSTEFKRIAQAIRRRYAMGQFTCHPGGLVKFSIGTGTDGHLHLTCRDMPGAVEYMARKYERGLPRRTVR